MGLQECTISSPGRTGFGIRADCGGAGEAMQVLPSAELED